MSQEYRLLKWKWQAKALLVHVISLPLFCICSTVHTVCSFRFHNVKCTHELFRWRFFFFFLLFVIDSIHFILFITMLFIWHDFCYIALPFINSLGCYYNLIWVIWCLTFTVIWCITLIWCSAQHRVYNRNSMTASHKIAISNLIYSHQYLLIHYELCMFFFQLFKMWATISASSFSFTGSVLNLYYPFHPVSKSQSAIVVWITSDKTSPFVCLAVGSVQVMFALSPCP